MNIKNALLTLALGAILSTSAIANNTIEYRSIKSTKTVTTEIKTLIKKLHLDYSKLENKTIKVTFMINESDELIILDTNESDLDSTLKNALNYKAVDSEGLMPLSVYVVPISFK